MKLVYARARRAVREIRRHAAELGLDRLTMSDIDREIAAARKARRRDSKGVDKPQKS